MRTRVKYIKATDNTPVGTEKLLQPRLARDLERQGFVEITGEGIASKRQTSKVDKVNVETKVIDLTPAAAEPAAAEPAAAEPAAAEPAQTTTDGPIDYSTLSFVELKAECAKANIALPVNPSKDKLIALLSNR